MSCSLPGAGGSPGGRVSCAYWAPSAELGHADTESEQMKACDSLCIRG